MKIERRPDGTTVIKHFPVLISLLVLFGVFGGLKLLIAPLLEKPPRFDALHAGIITLLLGLALAHFLWERVRFEFDPRRRIIAWRRYKLFTGITNGQIAFDDVTDVVIQTMSSVDVPSKLTRVAIVTKNQRLPLTAIFSSNNNQETAQTIRQTIGLESATKTF